MSDDLPLNYAMYNSVVVIPPQAQGVLDEVSRLLSLNPQVEPQRVHASVQHWNGTMEFCIGSNFEEGWATLVYQVPPLPESPRWVWRSPWDGDDTLVKEEVGLAYQFLTQVIDPLAIKV